MLIIEIIVIIRLWSTDWYVALCFTIYVMFAKWNTPNTFNALGSLSWPFLGSLIGSLPWPCFGSLKFTWAGVTFSTQPLQYMSIPCCNSLYSIILKTPSALFVYDKHSFTSCVISKDNSFPNHLSRYLVPNVLTWVSLIISLLHQLALLLMPTWNWQLMKGITGLITRVPHILALKYSYRDELGSYSSKTVIAWRLFGAFQVVCSIEQRTQLNG